MKRLSFRSFKEPVTVPGWAWWGFAFLVPLILIVPMVIVVGDNLNRASASIHIVNLVLEHNLLEKASDKEVLKALFSGSSAMFLLFAGIVAVVMMLAAVVMLSKQSKNSATGV